MPEVLGLIAARGGSKGVPRKNARPLGGRPLVAHAIQQGLASRYVTDLVVSTEDPEIAEIARASGAQVPFTRPADLATDESRQVAVAQHAVEFLERTRRKTYDAIALIQPTAPFRTSGDIDAAIAKLLDGGLDSVVSVAPVSQHPWQMYELRDDRLAKSVDVARVRRQERPPRYVANGAVYVARRDVVVIEGTFWGRECSAHVMSRERSINIDTPFDWRVAELLMGINDGTKTEARGE